MERDFSVLLVKEYQYWSVYLHENQGYLGRCVIWCKRENAIDLPDATATEQAELYLILKKVRSAVARAFGPDWFNYAFFGNETPHLHCHFIPRYAHSRNFAGMAFEDHHWGHDYRTDPTFITPQTVLAAIKAELIAKLG